MAVPDHDPSVLSDRPALLIIADKGYVSHELDAYLTERKMRLLRPSYRNRTPHPAQHLLKPVRQLIESANQTLKGQLDLELHGGHTIDGVTARIAPTTRPLIKFGITPLARAAPPLVNPLDLLCRNGITRPRRAAPDRSTTQM